MSSPRKTVDPARKRAYRRGALRYRPKERCIHGHPPERWTSTGACTKCSGLGQRKKYYTQRNYVRGLRSTQPCTDCGRKDLWYTMEFDHKNGRASANDCVSRLVGQVTMERLKKEIAKCDLVCVRCHKIRTAKRAGWI